MFDGPIASQFQIDAKPEIKDLVEMYVITVRVGMDWGLAFDSRCTRDRIPSGRIPLFPCLVAGCSSRR